MNTGFLMLIGGAAGAVVYLIYALIRGRRAAGVNGLSFLLLLPTLLLPLVARIVAPLVPGIDSGRFALGIAGGLIVGGLIVTIVESRRGDVGLNQSGGVLGAAAGVLLLVALLALPLLSEQLPNPASPTASQPVNRVVLAASEPSRPGQATPVPDNIILSTPVPAATRVPTQPTPTPTQFFYGDAPVTAAATETVDAATCAGTVQANLNLRAGPSTDAGIILTIPSGSTITITDENSDGSWLAVAYADESGWVSADFVAQPVGCDPMSAAAPVAAATTAPEPDEATVTNPDAVCAGVTTASLNMRSGPGMDFQLVGGVEPETTVAILAADDGLSWLQIDHDGAIGWVGASYVSQTGACADLPTASS